MFKSILVCTDGSEQAMNAARTAAQIACKFDAKVTLLNSFDDIVSTLPNLGVWELGIRPEEFVRYASEVQQDIEKRTGAMFEEAGVPFLPLREMGRPEEIILSVAERKHPDLIVMGSRGLGGFKRLMMGSVSDGVVHHASCPVLIERGQSASFHRILLASDASAGARKATSVAFSLAERFGAALTVLNVFEPSYVFADADANPNPAEAAEEQIDREKSFRAVEESLDAVEVKTEIPYFLHQERGHPAKAIVEYAELGKFDLVVMGSRGLGGFDRLLLGSVSDAVLHHANGAVLIVR